MRGLTESRTEGEEERVATIRMTVARMEISFRTGIPEEYELNL